MIRLKQIAKPQNFLLLRPWGTKSRLKMGSVCSFYFFFFKYYFGGVELPVFMRMLSWCTANNHILCSWKKWGRARKCTKRLEYTGECQSCFIYDTAWSNTLHDVDKQSLLDTWAGWPVIMQSIQQLPEVVYFQTTHCYGGPYPMLHNFSFLPLEPLWVTDHRTS